jgi:hypothetical protein
LEDTDLTQWASVTSLEKPFMVTEKRVREHSVLAMAKNAAGGRQLLVAGHRLPLPTEN